MPSLVAFPFFPILAEAIFIAGWVRARCRPSTACITACRGACAVDCERRSLIMCGACRWQLVVSAFLWSTGSVILAPEMEPLPALQPEGIVRMVARTANVTLAPLPPALEDTVTANAGSLAPAAPALANGSSSIVSGLPGESGRLRCGHARP